MTGSLSLFLDLGDLFTKGLAVGPNGRKRLRFPSVIAHRWLTPDTAADAQLLLDAAGQLIRPPGFEPQDYPRTRSFPGADELLREVHSGPHPTSRGRIAGWLAAALGEDRQVLGLHPSRSHVEALVHKALLLLGPGFDRAEVVFVVDQGAKADAIQRYVADGPHAVAIDAWSYPRARRQRLELSLRGQVRDGAACALAVLPPELDLAKIGRILIVDIGYRRTKLAILSLQGCEHQEQLEGLGISDCVHRVLRDGPELGLVEDELAVATALEQSLGSIEIAGRRFDITEPLQRSRRALEQEIANATRRVLLDHYNRGGEMCRAAAMIGGGARIVGRGVAARLEGNELRTGGAWVADESSFLLVDGAAQDEPSANRR